MTRLDDTPTLSTSSQGNNTGGIYSTGGSYNTGGPYNTIGGFNNITLTSSETSPTSSNSGQHYSPNNYNPPYHQVLSASPSLSSASSYSSYLSKEYQPFPTILSPTAGNGSEILVQVGGAASIKCYTNYKSDELVSYNKNYKLD